MRHYKLESYAAVFLLVCLLEFFERGSSCEKGWLNYRNVCILKSEVAGSRYNTFLQAHLFCDAQDSDLVSVSDIIKLQSASRDSAIGPSEIVWVDQEKDDDHVWKDTTEEDGQLSVRKRFIPLQDCSVYANSFISPISCNDQHEYICIKHNENRTFTNCIVNRQISIKAEISNNCLYVNPGMKAEDDVNELCTKDRTYFQDLNDIMKDGLTVLHKGNISTNNGEKYWTKLLWNGTRMFWPSGHLFEVGDFIKVNLNEGVFYFVLLWNGSRIFWPTGDLFEEGNFTEEGVFYFVPGSGDCIAVQFNFTTNLDIHLLQTECSARDKAVCAAHLDPLLETTTTTGVLLNDSTICPQGDNWKSDPLTNYCYWESSFKNKRLPWNEAESYCQSFGGHLVSMQSSEEEDIVRRIQNRSLSHPYWIGLHLDPLTETYKWSDGTLVNYSNWAPDHPNHRDKLLRCVDMKVKEAHWISSLCGILSWFICKVPKQYNPPEPVLPTPVPLQLCNNSDKFGLKFVANAYYFEGYCYYAVNTPSSWRRADRYCEKEGSSLVSIHSGEEVGFLLKLLYESVKNRDRAWIGLHSLGSDGNFQWTDWSPLDFTYWNENEPNNYLNREKCGVMYTGNGLWNDENCDDAMIFICKRKSYNTWTSTAPSTPDPRIGNCKKGWYAHHDRCYFLGGIREQDRMNWSEASQICQDNDGYLTSIRDDRDQAFLSYLLQFLRVDAWIGFHDTIQSGKYYWQDNSDVHYTSWAPGEPSFFGITEDCVKMIYDELESGVWKDDECHQKLGYICQNRKDPNLPEPEYNRSIDCLHPEGWLKLDSMCFKLFEGNVRTWQEAENACRSYGAHLVSVSDKRVNAIVSYLAAEGNKTFWIGLQYQESSQSISWVNGWPVTLSKWEKNEPGYLEKDMCFASTPEGYWKRLPCQEEIPYVCQITTGQPFQPEKYTGNCPLASEAWIPGPGSFCYTLEKYHLVEWFINANRLCSRYDSQLVSIHSLEEVEFLKTIMKPGIRSVYIGLMRNKKRGFAWTDASPVNFVNWDAHEPGNLSDHCVEMMADTMKWRMTRCMGEKHVICQANKDTLIYGDPQKEKLVDEEANGLSPITLIAIVVIIIVIIFVNVAAVLYSNRSVGRSRFLEAFRQKSTSLENALYIVDSASMEFQDETKCPL